MSTKFRQTIGAIAGAKIQAKGVREFAILTGGKGEAMGERESKRPDPKSTNRVGLCADVKRQRLFAACVPWTAMINGESR